MREKLLFIAGVVLLNAIGSAAVQVVPSSAGTVLSGSTGAQVTINGTGTVQVIADAADAIEWIRVSSSGGVTLRIGDDTVPGLSPSRLDEVRRVGGSGEVAIEFAVVDGDLGSSTSSIGILADNVIQFIEVRGDMLAPIIVNGEEFGFDSLPQLIVTGDLRNDVIANFAFIGSIDVGGSIIGAPTDPVVIRGDDDLFSAATIGTISAESIEHAVIDGRGVVIGGLSGRVTQIESRTGYRALAAEMSAAMMPSAMSAPSTASAILIAL